MPTGAARTPRDEQARSRMLPPPWLLIFAAWLVPSVLSGLNTYLQSQLEGRPPEWRWIFFNALDWLLYALLTPLVFRAGRRFPLRPPRLKRHIAVHVGGALSLCVVWASLGTLLRLATFPAARDAGVRTILMELLSWVFTTLPFGVGVYFALVGIEHALFYFGEARQRETQTARLAAQLSEARLSALRMQLNPHFLFNSLNAITVLVRDRNTDGAARMLELLSDVLRHVLTTGATQEIPLSSELEFLERYLAIEQIRFSDRLHPRIHIDPGVSRALVPGFLLQPLVENALRHGIARRADAGELDVIARRDGADLVITVRDDGPGLPPDFDPNAPTSGRVGLANTQARLAGLYGDRAGLRVANAEGGVIATVRLPYHEAGNDE